MTDWDNVKIASPYDDTPEAEVAPKEELEGVIGGQNLPLPPPMERFNPNLPYSDASMVLNERDEILLAAIKKAIANGWIGWRERVNDATTIGLEGEQLIKEMKKTKADAKSLLFDVEFAKYAGYNIIDLATAISQREDPILFIKGINANLSN